MPILPRECWRNKELAQKISPSPLSSMLKSSNKYFLVTPLTAQQAHAGVLIGTPQVHDFSFNFKKQFWLPATLSTSFSFHTKGSYTLASQNCW